ncbi:MAG: co-chaperone GroES, partial [Myxococcota bacterium]
AMTLKPLHDRVLLTRKEPEVQTKTGLFLPETARKKSQLAEVVAVGTGRIGPDGNVTPLKVEPGMTVMLTEWAGDEIKIDGTSYLFVREQDILAVAL